MATTSTCWTASRSTPAAARCWRCSVRTVPARARRSRSSKGSAIDPTVTSRSSASTRPTATRRGEHGSASSCSPGAITGGGACASCSRTSAAYYRPSRRPHVRAPWTSTSCWRLVGLTEHGQTRRSDRCQVASAAASTSRSASSARPDLLFLDEPTTGFDPQARRDFHDVVHRLADLEGTTILLTTHDLDEAEKLADRILILAGGRIVADGSAAELSREVEGRTEVRWSRNGEHFVHAADDATRFVRELFEQHGDDDRRPRGPPRHPGGQLHDPGPPFRVRPEPDPVGRTGGRPMSTQTEQPTFGPPPAPRYAAGRHRDDAQPDQPGRPDLDRRDERHLRAGARAAAQLRPRRHRLLARRRHAPRAHRHERRHGRAGWAPRRCSPSSARTARSCEPSRRPHGMLAYLVARITLAVLNTALGLVIFLVAGLFLLPGSPDVPLTGWLMLLARLPARHARHHALGGRRRCAP